MRMEGDGTNGLSFKKKRNTFKSTSVLIRDFNLPEVNWERHTVGTEDSSGPEYS